MRISTLAAIAAVPLAAAIAVEHRPHAAVYRRRQATDERGLIGDVIGEVFGITSDDTSTTPPAVSTSKPVVPPVVTPTDKEPSGSLTSTSAAVVPSSSQTAISSPPPSISSTSAVAPSSTSVSTSATPTTTSTTPKSSSTTSTPPAETSTQPTSTEDPTTNAPSTSTDASPMTTAFTTEENGRVVTVVKTYIPPTSSATGSAAAAKSEPGLSSGAKVGIIVASVIGGLIVLVGILFLVFRKRRSDDEPMRWPELNRHGDTPAHHAVPVSRSSGHGVEDRRMSLGDELDDPTYLGDVNASNVPHLNGSSFGAAAVLDYDEKAATNAYATDYPPHHNPAAATQPQGYAFDDPHSDYTSYPPPVQPQPSPVHGAPYDWEGSDGAYSSEHGYTGMTRQTSTSPTMQMAGVGAGGMTFPQPQAPSHHY